MAEREVVRAMLKQALVEARGGARIGELHLELFDSSPETERSIRSLVAELGVGTQAETARVITFQSPSRFIC